MNNKTVKRESGTKPFRFKHQGHTVEIDEDIFKKRHHLDDVIRLNKTEFSGLKEIKEFLTHFNLQHCTHKNGDTVVLVLIDQPGYYDGRIEVAPVLNLKNSLLAKCIDVKNNIPYERLTKNDFVHSFGHIKNAGALKQAVLDKYKNSMPHLTDLQILSLGVSMTKLKILGKFFYRL